VWPGARLGSLRLACLLLPPLPVAFPVLPLVLVPLPLLLRPALPGQRRLLIGAAQHDQRSEVVGVAKSVSAGYGDLDLVVDALDTSVAGSELHGSYHVGTPVPHLLLDCDDGRDPAVCGGLQPGIEQPLCLMRILCAEDSPQDPP
jgi:hypothetical protein